LGGSGETATFKVRFCGSGIPVYAFSNLVVPNIGNFGNEFVGNSVCIKKLPPDNASILSTQEDAMS